ncbi:AEC family transporter [Lapillicoccus sp.]|uniref:AEC family transporter n=1 Tax=Lapillicoccus sp. TaxID=1909287 RepID=UPI003982E1C5
MLGVLQGFATIGAVVGLGFLLAHWRILDISAQNLLSRLAFYVASPALLIVVMSRTRVEAIFSANLVASFASVVITVAIYLAVARWRWRPPLGESVIGSLCAAYVNAGNLGLPIALYVLGDISLMAPTLLMQLLVLTPVAMAVLDGEARGHRPTLGTSLVRVVRNPITAGALIGLLASFVRVPTPVLQPIELVGNMAVPAMLIAFGISLRRGPRPGTGGSWSHVATMVSLKLVVQPLAAVSVGYLAVGLRGHALFAAAVTAALPTAQNVFTYANRYNRALFLARDAIFASTVLSIPVILLIAFLLGRP